MTFSTTFRAQMRAGCKSVLDTLKTNNPTLLAHVYDHRPGSYRTPLAFVDNVITETVDHTASLRGRVLVARVYFVNRLLNSDQSADEQDALTDLALDAFSNTPRAASSTTLLEPISVDADELTDGEATYAAAVVNVRGRVWGGGD